MAVAFSASVYIRLAHAEDSKSAAAYMTERIRTATANVDELESIAREAPWSRNGVESTMISSRRPVFSRACQALLTSNEAACGGAIECRELSSKLFHSKVLLTAAAAPAAAKRMCVDMKTEELSQDRGSRSLVIADPKAYCDIYVNNVDLHERVAKLVGLLGVPAGGKEAAFAVAFEEKRERLYLGLSSSEACFAQKGAWTETESCVTARLYQQAYTQKNPALCGKSGLCRALMGQPACGVYAEGAASVEGPENNRKLWFEQLLQTQRDMVALSAAVDGGKGLPGYAQRKKQVADLHRRCNHLIETMENKPVKRPSKGGSAGSSGP